MVHKNVVEHISQATAQRGKLSQTVHICSQLEHIRCFCQTVFKTGLQQPINLSGSVLNRARPHHLWPENFNLGRMITVSISSLFLLTSSLKFFKNNIRKIMHVTSHPCQTVVKCPKLRKYCSLPDELPTPTKCCRSLLRRSASYGLIYKFSNASIKKFQNRHRKFYQCE